MDKNPKKNIGKISRIASMAPNKHAITAPSRSVSNRLDTVAPKKVSKRAQAIEVVEDVTPVAKSLPAFHEAYAAQFAIIPSDYRTLKEEALYLARLSGHAFVLMAARLRRIRDEALYREDGYETFKEFVDKEMSLARSTVYNYMDILDAFGEENLLAEPELEYTKLMPAIPLLRAKGVKLPKARIKKQFIAKAKTSTKKEMVDTAKELKTLYGLTPRVVSASAKADPGLRNRGSAIAGELARRSPDRS